MSREVRMVPADWVHPMSAEYPDRHEPMFEGSWYASSLEDYENDKNTMTAEEFEEEHGEWGPPNPDNYMPLWSTEEATHYMMYETTSEGSPISPAFETPEELAHWLVDDAASAFAGQTASYEGWLRVAKGGYAPSAIISSDGMVSGVDAL